MKELTNRAESFANRSVVFYSVLALSTLPLWMTTYLPMVDLPQHAGQITALREYLNGNPVFTEPFEINWFTPYLLGYLLVYALSSVFSLAFSTKLLVAAAVIGLPMAARRMLDYCGADKDLAYLVIPASYGLSFYWGFLSFLVAAPFGLLFFMLAVSFARNPAWPKAVGIVLFAVFLFFSHLMVLVLASAVSVAYGFFHHLGSIRRQLIHVVPFVVPVPLVLAWMLIIKDDSVAVREAAPVYASLLANVTGLLTKHTGLSGLGIVPALVMTAATFGYPLMAKYRVSRKPERWLPFVIVLAFYFIVPWALLGSVYLNERFGIFLAVFWFLAFDRPEHVQPRVMLVPAAALFAFLAVTFVSFNDFDRDARDFDRLTAQMEPGKRVLQMPVYWSGPGFDKPVFAHFASWYQANQAGIVDFNFAYFYPMMLHYREGVDAPVNNRFTWAPLSFTWATHQGDVYDYFIARFPQDISTDLFKDATDRVEVVGNEGMWWLYRRVGQGSE